MPTPAAASRGGGPASSTRCTPGPSPTPTATAWATSRASGSTSTTWPGWASTPSGCRRSTARPWPTSATTWPTTATSTPCSATSPTSTASLADAHALGIRVVVDWVPNHTSDQHPWFQAARSSRDDPKRDWYVWRDGGGPDGAAQQLDGRLHRGRPGLDLGRRHRAVVPAPVPARAARPELGQPRGRRGHARRHAVLARPGRRRVPHRRRPLHRAGPRPSPTTSRPWAEHPPLRVQRAPEHPRAHPGHAPAWPTGTTATGCWSARRPCPAPAGWRPYYGDGDELHLAFNFAATHAPWDAGAWRHRIERHRRGARPAGRLADLGAVQPRHPPPPHPLRRLRGPGPGGGRRPAHPAGHARSSTPARSSGLEDAVVPADRVVDPGGRDGCRAPIPWDRRRPATAGAPTPWLPFPPEAAGRSRRAAQRADPTSILHLYRRLLAARRASPALSSATSSCSTRRRACWRGAGSDGERRAHGRCSTCRRRAGRGVARRHRGGGQRRRTARATPFAGDAGTRTPPSSSGPAEPRRLLDERAGPSGSRARGGRSPSTASDASPAARARIGSPDHVVAPARRPAGRRSPMRSASMSERVARMAASMSRSRARWAAQALTSEAAARRERSTPSTRRDLHRLERRAPRPRPPRRGAPWPRRPCACPRRAPDPPEVVLAGGGRWAIATRARSASRKRTGGRPRRPGARARRPGPGRPPPPAPERPGLLDPPPGPLGLRADGGPGAVHLALVVGPLQAAPRLELGDEAVVQLVEVGDVGRRRSSMASSGERAASQSVSRSALGSLIPSSPCTRPAEPDAAVADEPGGDLGVEEPGRAPCRTPGRGSRGPGWRRA